MMVVLLAHMYQFAKWAWYRKRTARRVLESVVKCTFTMEALIFSLVICD